MESERTFDNDSKESGIDDGYNSRNNYEGKNETRIEGVNGRKGDVVDAVHKDESKATRRILYSEPEKTGTYEDYKSGVVDLSELQRKATIIREMNNSDGEEKNAVQNANLKKNVLAVLPNGTEKTFGSVIEAADWCNVDKSAISKCCHGKMPHVKGVKFRFIDIEDINSVLNSYINDVERLSIEKMGDELDKIKK